MMGLIQVHRMDSMGNDLTVVNAARVSFDKFKEELEYSDEKLIQYLAEHGHWSPFSHCFIQFKIDAPIFIARQLMKHTVGLAWNEVSRRYVDNEPKFYTPFEWRRRAADKKQGSMAETVPSQDIANRIKNDSDRAALRLKEDAQQETQEVAKHISDHCAVAFPISWKNLVKEDKQHVG